MLEENKNEEVVEQTEKTERIDLYAVRRLKNP